MRLYNRLFHTEHHRSARENLFEAIVAGIYLDGGLDEAKKFVKRFLFTKIPVTVCNRKNPETCRPSDYKGKLQEHVQKYKLGTLLYVVKDRSGPDHDPLFTIAVTIDDKEIASAKGRKKSDAEKESARLALEILLKSNKQVKTPKPTPKTGAKVHSPKVEQAPSHGKGNGGGKPKKAIARNSKRRNAK